MHEDIKQAMYTDKHTNRAALTATRQAVRAKRDAEIKELRNKRESERKELKDRIDNIKDLIKKEEDTFKLKSLRNQLQNIEVKVRNKIKEGREEYVKARTPVEKNKHDLDKKLQDARKALGVTKKNDTKKKKTQKKNTKKRILKKRIKSIKRRKSHKKRN